MDDSMASSPVPSSSFDGPISPMTFSNLSGREAGSSSSSSWPFRPGRVDSLGLSGIGSLHLKDGSLSPLPRSGSFLETVGEEGNNGWENDGSDAASAGVFGMEQHSPLSVAVSGENLDLGDMDMDTDMDSWIPCVPLPANTNPVTSVPADVDSLPFSFPPAGTRLGRSYTDPSCNYRPPPTSEIPRRMSVKRTRDYNKMFREVNILCDCPLPDRPKHGQKKFLLQLPTEILEEIIRYAILWSPKTRPTQCEHQLRRPLERRATTGDACPRPRLFAPSWPAPAAASSSSAVLDASEPADQIDDENSEEARRFGINTLVRLGYTCKRFYGLIWSDDFVSDGIYWGDAARSCWKKLPNRLCDVQGQLKESQTTWRNLVAVFARSENSQFGTTRGRGKGGVDCFGGKKACNPSSTWSNEKARRKAIERDGRIPRRLVLACAQPGPDGFTVNPDEDSKSWTITLQLRYGEEYLVHLDEYGRFGEAGKLPEGLRGSQNPGYFSPNIYKDAKDRFQIVKVQVRKGLRVPQFTGQSRGNTVHEAITWDLSCIPDCAVDEKASVARCTNHEGLLLCSLFTHRNPSPLDELLDPPEDARLFCIETRPGGLEVIDEDEEMNGMSSKKRGKLPQKNGFDGAGTVYRWGREFVHQDQNVAGGPRGLHPVICRLQMNSKNVVALIRWNETTPTSMQQLYDRQFHIINPQDGTTVKLLEFPNLYWDYRHHDMHREYNLMRVEKLQQLYNPRPNKCMGSGNRCTRIHGDAFFLTENHIIGGSHDYCNWIWPLDRATPAKGEYNPEHNDGGIIDEPFDVLDDYYWNNNAATSPEQSKQWNPLNERAGWWVKTPNQVLCFWHGVAMNHEQTAFAVCRPGKMFVWDLNTVNEVRGYSCLSPAAGERERWLGKPRKEIQKPALDGWYLCEDVLPEQGLWLLYEDGESVFINRDEILEACGIDAQWGFGREEFGWEEEEVLVAAQVPEESENESESEPEPEEKVGKRRRISYESRDADEDMSVPVFWE